MHDHQECEQEAREEAREKEEESAKDLHAALGLGAEATPSYNRSADTYGSVCYEHEDGQGYERVAGLRGLGHPRHRRVAVGHERAVEGMEGMAGMNEVEGMPDEDQDQDPAFGLLLPASGDSGAGPSPNSSAPNSSQLRPHLI